ncbi:thiamine pyrophosphate-binding protein [Halorussus rarus]|uniref:thiamine pyrophosphate-binding protein n=1 Tax=Halorussus TaxID=1070314 RepID=UPI000E21225D|nr:thiamine pyrophosphate-binding protein [Halorussus rarus]NHN61663.1 thiamine pyrophosphate-binding protein [Halorussus sp. JP-T4]
MTVNQAVIDSLVDNDVDTVFGIPGKQSLPLNETIGERDDIRFVVARHETAVTHQAWGYASTGDRMAATVVVPGPGDMNAMNGLKNALNDCVPLVHFAIETDPDLRGGDAIHETPPDTYDNVVKENVLVETPEATVAEVERAIAVARTPPKGPVRVGIPKSFLAADAALADPPEFDTEYAAGVPADAVAEARDLLADAADPVVLAGGGVRAAGATDELVAVAERLGAPIVTTYKGKGVVPERHDLSAGTLSGSASPELLTCLADADACLAVGTDLDAHASRGWSVELPDALVHATLGAGDIGRGYEPTVGIVGDARGVLASLAEGLDDAGIDRADLGAERASAVRDATDERLDPLLGDSTPITSVRALRAIRNALPEEAVVAVDAGGFRVWALNVFDAAGPRKYVNPGSWATMGTGLPSAIGAAYANPDAPVVALTGDGGLMMCVHELHTAAVEDLPVTVVVLNNDDYAIISEEAGRSYRLSEQEYGWADAPVDFTAVAEGMGVDAYRADAPADIRDGLDAALRSDGPALVEVRTDPLEPQASQFMAE